MRRLLGVALGVALGVLTALWLVPAQAGASTLADCLAEQHVCVDYDNGPGYGDGAGYGNGDQGGDFGGGDFGGGDFG